MLKGSLYGWNYIHDKFLVHNIATLKFNKNFTFLKRNEIMFKFVYVLDTRTYHTNIENKLRFV
jgi:hypothetical protein